MAYTPYNYYYPPPPLGQQSQQLPPHMHPNHPQAYPGPSHQPQQQQHPQAPHIQYPQHPPSYPPGERMVYYPVIDPRLDPSGAGSGPSGEQVGPGVHPEAPEKP